MTDRSESTLAYRVKNLVHDSAKYVVGTSEELGQAIEGRPSVEVAYEWMTFSGIMLPILAGGLGLEYYHNLGCQVPEECTPVGILLGSWWLDSVSRCRDCGVNSGLVGILKEIFQEYKRTRK